MHVGGLATNSGEWLNCFETVGICPDASRGIPVTVPILALTHFVELTCVCGVIIIDVCGSNQHRTLLSVLEILWTMQSLACPCASVSIETLIPNAKPETRCLMRLVQSTGFHVMIDLQPLKSSDFPLLLQVVEELRAGDVLIQLTLSFMASRVLDTFLHAYRSHAPFIHSIERDKSKGGSGQTQT